MSPLSAPAAAETSARAWSHFLAWYRQLLELVETQDLPGSCGVRPVSLPRSQTPFGPVGLTLTANTMLSPWSGNEDTNVVLISRLTYAALTLAAYASSSALLHSPARLASGWWLAFAVRESIPLDSDEWFQSSTSGHPPLPGSPSATRLYLCESFSACLDPPPGCSCGALTRFFPHDIGLPRSCSGSALHNILDSHFSPGGLFGAAAISSCSGPPVCLPPRWLPPRALSRRRAAVASTSGHPTVRYLPVVQIC